MSDPKNAGLRGTPITIRGTEYPTARAAAEALGMSKAAVYSAKRRGNLDRLGLGIRVYTTARPGRTPKPVVIGGETYASARAAAEALKISVSYAHALAAKAKKEISA